MLVLFRLITTQTYKVKTADFILFVSTANVNLDLNHNHTNGPLDSFRWKEGN